MAAVRARRTLLTLWLLVAACTAARAQAAPAPSGATAVWTLKTRGDIRWQQVTPAGALLVSTDASLAGVDIDRGQVTWERPELGGLPADSVRMVEGSLLMEAARPGLLLIFDPVTGAVVFDSRRLSLTQVVTRRVLPQSGTLLVHGRRASGPPVVALYDLVTGDQRWANEGLFEQSGPAKRGLGGLMQGLARAVSGGIELGVLQAGPDMIVVHTLLGLRALDARTGAVRWSAGLPTARAGNPARHVRLYPSLDKPDRIYVSFDDRLMAFRLADGQALWAKPPTIEGWVHNIVQHPSGIIILPESPPPDQATGNVRIVNGVVQTGLNVARYEDGTTIAAKPLRMRGTVTDAMITGGSAVLAVDAESRTFVNVLDVATATLRLNKDVKIKGRLAYAELTPAGLLYISRPDPATNAEVNVIDLAKGEPRFKDAIESGKPWGGNDTDYDAARYYLHHAVEGRTLYVFANRDHRLYAVDRDAGTFHALGGEIKLQGGEDPTDMEIRPAGIVLIAPQNLVVGEAAGLLPGATASRAAARAPSDQRGTRRSVRRRRLGVRRCLRPGVAHRHGFHRATHHRAAGDGVHTGRRPARGLCAPVGGARHEAFQGLAHRRGIGLHADARARWQRQRAAPDRQGQRAAAVAGGSRQGARAGVRGGRRRRHAVPAHRVGHAGRLPALIIRGRRPAAGL